MFGKVRSWQWLVGATVLAAVEFAGVFVVEIAVPSPAQAQFGSPYQRPQRRSPSFFQDLFGGPSNDQPGGFDTRPRTQPVDSSRAPPARKPDPAAAPPTTSILVMGDGMADWLAHGLEDAFSDAPEVGIVRENKLNSGLIRYEPKGDLDWGHVARDQLAKNKANYVVMMLGLADRQNIREKDVAKPDKEAGKDKDKKDPKDAKNADKDATKKKDQPEDAEQGAIVAPEPKAAPAHGVIEFRSDRWAEVYSRRIDDTIAALKSKGVPVFWVGLPSIRGTRSTSEASYLNELFRARAEKAGIVYIDVWDGFVDEGGKYSNFGPDYEGQIRRLRSSDGVFFTKYGARKLAHYVEREIRRYMNNRALPMALPMGPIESAPSARSTVRPLAGPVVPLTLPATNSEELAGGRTPQPAHGDATAAQVLVRGDSISAPAGRADDFAWPAGSRPVEPMASAPAAPAAPVAAAPPAPEVKPAADKPAPKSVPAEKTVQKDVKPKPARPPQLKPRRPDDDFPRPPAPIGRSAGPFGWIR
jgi:hypothetical protein